MKFKIGDRVKFLNQKGGGTITKIISSQIVNVMDEDEFEVPTLIKDLVKIDENASSSAKMFQEIPAAEQKPANIYAEEENEEFGQHITPLKRGYPSDQIPKGIYLAFVPHEQQWLLMGDIDMYVINHTRHEVFYSLFLNNLDGGFEGVDYSMIPPLAKSLVTTIEREEINRWLKGVIQVLFHSGQIEEIIPPLDTAFKISGDKLYKESSFSYVSIMKEKTLLVKIQEILC